MKKFLSLFIFIFSAAVLQAQQFNCNVVINAEQTGRSNMPIFKTLENSVKEFVNETAWADKAYTNQEKIDCSIYINIIEFDGDDFKGTIQIQSSRPVFNSTYTTPIFNFNDEQLTFNYTEHQPLRFDRNSYSSNLVSVLAFYAYTMLGIDADSFELEGGSDFYAEASQVVGTAQQGRASGWRATDGSRSRYRLNTDLLSSAFSGYRKALYKYHRLGLDNMADNPEEAKSQIVASLEDLKEMSNRRSNSLLLRVFFDAKAGEIEKIFSAGPEISLKETMETLNRIAPSYADNWKNIR